MNTQRDFTKEPYTILCYGDSNTWGCIPCWEESDAPSSRYPVGVRWPTVVQQILGSTVQVIEEGLGGRTTRRVLVKANGEGRYKVGTVFLPTCLLSHRPLDMVVIMLGTNDLHVPICPPEEELGRGVRELIELIDRFPKAWRDGIRPKILLVAPPCIQKARGRREFWMNFGEEGLRLSHLFGKYYKEVADSLNVDFLDAGEFVGPSEADGVHLTAEGQRLLGEKIAEKIRLITA